MSRQLGNLDSVYSSRFLAREEMGFSDCGPLAASLPVSGSFIWMLHSCSGASSVLHGGKGTLSQDWSETWTCMLVSK